MKVLFIEPSIKNFSGYFRAFNICQALSKKNISVDLLVSSNKKFNFFIKKTIVNPNFEIYELPRIYLTFYIQGRILRGLIATIFGLIKKYDIVHVAMPQVPEGTIPAYLLKLFNKKIVIDWDEMYENGVYKNTLMTHAYIKIFEHLSPKIFKYYCVDSEILGQIVLKRGALDYVKIINGVNLSELKTINKSLARRQLKLDQKTKYLLSFGNTYSGRRVYLLFKTYYYINKLDPTIKFLANFDPEKLLLDNGYLSNFPKSLFKSFIHIGQFNPLPKLGIYMSAADATLFLMDNILSDRSCYPTRTSTYLCGESVIILNDNDSEVSNTLKQFDCTIMAKTPKLLAKKAIKMLNDQKTYHQLKLNAKKAKKALAYDNIILKLIDFYQKIIPLKT